MNAGLAARWVFGATIIAIGLPMAMASGETVGQFEGILDIGPVKRAGTVQFDSATERGGVPREITPVGPSYLHGWSPDGKRIAFVSNTAGGD